VLSLFIHTHTLCTVIIPDQNSGVDARTGLSELVEISGNGRHRLSGGSGSSIGGGSGTGSCFVN